ncbi:anti-sigma factor family protein [Promicromonospora aerolata]|uniref:Anti-sigma factor family protein n=1 Tax=Promicromonospora aerolata TaxID=195749 RepID=A0ABW4V330_9MICO
MARLLQAYLDGELDAGRARRVAVHLDGCWRCGLEASAYEAIKVAVSAVSTHGGPVSHEAVARLRDFADRLAEAQP